MTESIRIFIGYDGGEGLASLICQKSIWRRTDHPLQIFLLDQRILRSLGLYIRDRDPRASTEFTYTRFLVPALCGYQGWALFVDADFLFQADISELWALRDSRYAVQVVKHNYQPEETTKMGGIPQAQYPRKNWSSLILWNCGHEASRTLALHTINSQSGAYLHRFQWVLDQHIGSLPAAWNHLEPQGVTDQLPKAIHYTMGIPGIHRGSFNFTSEWEDEVRA